MYMQPQPEDVIAALYSPTYRKMVVALTAYFGFASMAEAEDLVQETFATALERWREQGIPADPEKWLFKVCKNKALNFQKKKQLRQQRGYAPAHAEAYQLEEAFAENEIEDRELRMIYACCHPQISVKAQLVLILKSLCGFSTEKAANSLGMNAEALRKLHYRTLQYIKEAKIPLLAPQLLRLRERTENVHRSIYLLFNEGYLAYQGSALLDQDACQEALRLIRLLLRHPALCTADSYALYALFLFHLARLSARTSPAGELLELEAQDRSQWHKSLIQLGVQQLNKGLQLQKVLSRYLLEALIASLHCTAPSFKATDWPKICRFYQLLLLVAPSPYVALNKAIALYFAHGAAAATHYLQQSPYLATFQEHYLYHSFLGRLSLEKKDTPAAKSHYERALSLSSNQLEKDFLLKKLQAIV